MIRALSAVLLVGTMLAGPAWAEEAPVPGRHDPRVRTVIYDPMNVVKVVAAERRSTAIEFAADEVVDKIANGDDKGWVVAPAANRIFIMPNGDAGTPGTNMQVVTRRSDGTTRLYQFDLTASASPDAGSLMAGIVFQYPADVAAARRAAATQARAEAQSKVARDRLDVDFMYGPRNWRYTGRGAAAIEPTEVSDNGLITALRFPGNQSLPTVYTGECGAKEQVAATNMKDDLIIIHSTAQSLCLRQGDLVFEIKNIGYDPYGFNPGTATTTPEVKRSIKRRGTGR